MNDESMRIALVLELPEGFRPPLDTEVVVEELVIRDADQEFDCLEFNRTHAGTGRVALAGRLPYSALKTKTAVAQPSVESSCQPRYDVFMVVDTEGNGSVVATQLTRDAAESWGSFINLLPTKAASIELCGHYVPLFPAKPIEVTDNGVMPFTVTPFFANGTPALLWTFNTSILAKRNLAESGKFVARELRRLADLAEAQPAPDVSTERKPVA